MTISDKIRIYELSRDLNLENKDILDAAQKLSISVKSHSSSISAEDAKKIKNLLNKKNSDKQILSINKSSIKDNSTKKPLLTKPLNKPESLKIIPNQLKNPNKTNVVNRSQANPINQNIKNKPTQNFSQDNKTLGNNLTPPIKSQSKTSHSTNLQSLKI